jgi:hypothetical protein
MEDEMRLVVVAVSRVPAEDAALIRQFFLDVLIAPGAP